MDVENREGMRYHGSYDPRYWNIEAKRGKWSSSESNVIPYSNPVGTGPDGGPGCRCAWLAAYRRVEIFAR